MENIDLKVTDHGDLSPVLAPHEQLPLSTALEAASLPAWTSFKSLPLRRQESHGRVGTQRASCIPVRGHSLEPLERAFVPPRRKKSEVLPRTSAKSDDENILIEVKFENPQLQKHFLMQKARIDQVREELHSQRNSLPSQVGSGKRSGHGRR